MSAEKTDNKAKFFIKDGDDYIPKRTRRVPEGYVRQVYTQCQCGGKLKPRGAADSVGRLSFKCSKCGRRKYQQLYKGKDGLAQCY
jgi:hypothetical protein